MCNSGVHRPYGGGVVDPFPFSTFHFLRTCNRLIVPTDLAPYYGLVKDTAITDSTPDSNNNKTSHSYRNSEGHCSEIASLFTSPFVKDPSQVNAAVTRIPCSTPPVNVVDTSVDYPLVASGRGNSLSYSALLHRRQRGEKRPIPEEQKDEKYYERRKRNNEAAKKSRDARKMREDRIAFRAAILEQENAILRAQIVALRDEMTTLRQVMAARPPQIPVNI